MKCCNICGAELPRPDYPGRNVYCRCPKCGQAHRASFTKVGNDWSWSWKMTRARVLTGYVSFRAELELQEKCAERGDEWIRRALRAA